MFSNLIGFYSYSTQATNDRPSKEKIMLCFDDTEHVAESGKLFVSIPFDRDKVLPKICSDTEHLKKFIGSRFAVEVGSYNGIRFGRNIELFK